jgi:hypothetical protein
VGIIPHNSQKYMRWVQEMRQQARERVRRFARDHWMPFPD